MIKYVLFDVAETLLYKPSVLPQIQQVLSEKGYNIDPKELALRHKLLSEFASFPDRTDALFYAQFNNQLLLSLGILPDATLADDIFKACSYLPWEKFADTVFLEKIQVPIGVLSNFNTSLKEKLNIFFGDIFKDVFVSEELGVAKPALPFFQKAIDTLNLDPSEILYIGDSVKLDMQPAQRMGLNAVLIDRHDFFPLFPNRMTHLSDIFQFLA